MHNPKRPLDQDPGTPDEALPDNATITDEIPQDDGSPMNDWEIPTGIPDVIV